MNKRLPILFGIFLVLVAIWISVSPPYHIGYFIERLDHLGYDLQLRAKVLTQRTSIKESLKNSPVAIIDIDDRSLKVIGRWPWPRGELAKLVSALQQQGAQVIAFDILFAEKEENIAQSVLDELSKTNQINVALKELLTKNKFLFDEDSQLARILSAEDTILAFSFLPREQTQNQLPSPLTILSEEETRQLGILNARGYISNIAVLQEAAKGGGFINIYPDYDGIIRRAPLLIEYRNGVYPALALQAVISFLGKKAELVTEAYGEGRKLEGIKLDVAMIPTNARGEVLIPFVGRSYTFPYYSAIDVLNGKIPKDALLGKILFVGTSATGLGDLHTTAIQNPFPGVEIQATLVEGLLKNSFSYQPEWIFAANLMITVILGALSALFFPYFGPRTLAIIIIFFPAALFTINNWIWQETGLVLFIVLPTLLVLAIALLNIIYGYLFETRRRERLKEMFGQYVPEKHIEKMLKTSSNYGLHGEDREMTVLFADIRNFTSVSEGMPAAELVELLNTFFTPMTEVIFEHRGTIDKYVGDLIMAFWGAPLKDKRHAYHAIFSAILMQKKVKDLRAIFLEHQWPEIKIGIGINSGIMSVGDMGSRFRRNYTVLGDAVNLASRIEGLTKFYGVDIIVTEYTMKDEDQFVFRKLDLVRVKGKQKNVILYEVVGIKADVSPRVIEELRLYHQGLEHYFKQEWEETYKLISSLHQDHPHKKIYKIYLERIDEFKKNKIPSDWDGVYTHIVK